MEVVASVSSVELAFWASSVLEAMVAETVVTAAKSLCCLLFVTGCLLNDIDHLPKLTAISESFPFEELHKITSSGAENKDASDTEDDDEDDNDDNADDDEDAGDEDFSGDEQEEADPEDDPEVNGEGESDDDDDDDGDEDEDDDGDEDDAEDDGEDEEDEEEEEEIPQPPAKKRK